MMADAMEGTDVDKGSSEPGSGLTYQSITDAERQMANAAYRQFQVYNFRECRKMLKSLQASRPQDTKVFHNLCVTEYYQSKCRKFAELYNNLLMVCKQANIEVEDIDSIDDVDQCVVFYNRAVILYHLNKFRGAIRILDKVFQFIEPLDEALGRNICLLLVELYLCTHQPKKAFGLIGYMEAMLVSGPSNKSNKSPEKEEATETRQLEKLKLKLVQRKARCYTMLRTAKPCKRELKTLMTSGSKAYLISALVIKSQLEYQRGNYRKAIKILNSPEWPSDYSRYYLETGDCLQTMYYNNLACIHYYMGKPHLGAFYIERGMRELEAILKLKDESPTLVTHPLHTLSLGVRKRLIYNLAMQYFQQQNYLQAFKSFLQVSECYYDNPRLWLRIAECCIQIHRLNCVEDKGHQTVRSIIGTGKHKKAILESSKDSTIKPVADSSGAPVATLSFAVCALRNALMLLPKDLPPNVCGEEALTIPQTADEKDINPLEENCVQATPCNAIPFSEVQSLRNAILAALSYTSLRVGDLILAHEYAIQLLAQPRLSEGHRYLAHMYAGEALVYLDKISQAVEHFNPEQFSDVSLTLPLLSAEETASKHPVKADTPDRSDDSTQSSRIYPAWSPDNISAAQLISQYNLSVVYALRGEWAKALHLVSKIVNDENAPHQAKSLIIYINLCKGSTDTALTHLRETLPAYKR